MDTLIRKSNKKGKGRTHIQWSNSLKKVRPMASPNHKSSKNQIIQIDEEIRAKQGKGEKQSALDTHPQRVELVFHDCED